MNKTVFITGATSGIGEACARKYATENCNLILAGRRIDRLNQIKEELSSDYPIEIIVLELDVRQLSAVTKASALLESQLEAIDLLINNAGLAAGKDNFENASIDDYDQMIDTNVSGLIYVTKKFLPFLLKSKSPHIVNIGSIAAKNIYENGSVYCASKAAVDALSQGLRIDLLKHGVKVTAIHPGAANTEFSMVRFKGNQEMADATYAGYTPLSAEDIADTIFYCTSLPAHVCINELTIMPTAQADAFNFFKG